MGRFKRLLSNTAILGAGTFISKVLVFLLMPLYTALLSTEEFGTADILTQTANLLIPLAALGIADGLFRFALDAEGEQRKEVFTTALSVVVVGILPLTAIIQLLRLADIYDGYMGQTGCVSYLFTEKGVIIISHEDEDIDEDKLMETALEAGAEDFASEGEVFEIYTEPDDLYAVKEALEAAGYTVASAEKDKIPSNYVTLETEEDIKFMGLLIEKLEDDDDVMNVYHNWENCD